MNKLFFPNVINHQRRVSMRFTTADNVNTWFYSLTSHEKTILPLFRRFPRYRRKVVRKCPNTPRESRGVLNLAPRKDHGNEVEGCFAQIPCFACIPRFFFACIPRFFFQLGQRLRKSYFSLSGCFRGLVVCFVPKGSARPTKTVAKKAHRMII